MPDAFSFSFVDPHLQQGGDFNVIGLGGNRLMALCPACYRAAANSVLSDMQGAMDGEVSNVNWNSVNWNSVNWNS